MFFVDRGPDNLDEILFEMLDGLVVGAIILSLQIPRKQQPCWSLGCTWRCERVRARRVALPYGALLVIPLVSTNYSYWIHTHLSFTLA
jgi:hypothetical protein